MQNQTNDRIDEILEGIELWYKTENPKHLRSISQQEARQAIQKLLIEARMDENRALKQADERSWKVDNDFLIPDKYASRRIFQLQDQLNTLEGKS